MEERLRWMRWREGGVVVGGVEEEVLEVRFSSSLQVNWWMRRLEQRSKERERRRREDWGREEGVT